MMQVYNVVAADAPRAGSAEAKRRATLRSTATGRCTPCRQRRGKGQRHGESLRQRRCTPCRQRRGKDKGFRPSRPASRDAPRAGSAEAKASPMGGGSGNRDAPRAGSAKRNNNVPPDGSLTTGRHFFTFHPSRIPTVAPSSSVTMYNPAPHLLDRSSMAKQNLSHRANVICDGSPVGSKPEIELCLRHSSGRVG